MLQIDSYVAIHSPANPVSFSSCMPLRLGLLRILDAFCALKTPRHSPELQKLCGTMPSIVQYNSLYAEACEVSIYLYIHFSQMATVQP